MASAGRVLFIVRGDWNASATYTEMDLAVYNDILWVATASSTNETPSTTSRFWQKLIQGGSGSGNVDGKTLIKTEDNTLAVNIDGDTLQYDPVKKVLVAVTKATDKASTTALGHVKIPTDGTITIDTDGTIHGVKITVDSVLSKESENPVQNKAIAVELEKKANSEDVEDALDEKANKYTLEEKTLYANNWTNDTAPYEYELGYDATVDITLLEPYGITVAEHDACVSAQISSNGTNNVIRAYGDKPTINIPIVVKVEKK